MKNKLLEHIPKDFQIESVVNHYRVFNEIPNKKGLVIYLCTRDIRAKDNFALQFAIQKSEEYSKNLKIIHPKINYEYQPKQDFIDKQINYEANVFKKNGFDFEIFSGNLNEYIKSLNPALIITDFNPINKTKIDFKTLEIDSHNLVPARYISYKKEYNAATFRRKFYKSVYPFFREYNNKITYENEADAILKDFILNKLEYYAEYKNNPTIDVLSGLSKYLNLGFISSQRVAIEILKSKSSIENKESFLEELLIRKELADNFCLYSNNYKFDIPLWAKNSLIAHKNDIKPYIYDISSLNSAQTHDELWNATQNQLKKEGVIHSYLRMYWAKKILEWSNDYKSAIKIAIKFNDYYAFDAPSTNGYVGILWSIGGLHDRAFMDFFVTGKIRRMTTISKKKFIKDYIKKYNK